MSLDHTLYFEDVKEGEAIPTFQRQTDFMTWNRYAAVNDEFVYIHMDDEAGRAAGMPSAFGMGNVRYAYLHNMLREWIGLSGDIRKINIQYRGINYKNDVLTTHAKVARKYVENGEHLVDLEIWVENQKGENITSGQATVAIPSRG